MVSVGQITALIDFLEGRPDLARGHLSRTKEGRCLSARLWTACATVLNRQSAGCVQKKANEWRTYYNEYKSKLIKRIKLMKGELTPTGGVPAKKLLLTPCQKRLCKLLRKDVSEPLPGVPAKIPTLTLEAEDRGRRTAVDEHTPVVPTPRRRRRRQRREPSTDMEDGQPDSALRSATNTLENMEKLSAEAAIRQADALREHAQAVREHAAAINRLAASLEMIGQNMPSI